MNTYLYLTVLEEWMRWISLIKGPIVQYIADCATYFKWACCFSCFLLRLILFFTYRTERLSVAYDYTLIVCLLWNSQRVADDRRVTMCIMWNIAFYSFRLRAYWSQYALVRLSWRNYCVRSRLRETDSNACAVHWFAKKFEYWILSCSWTGWRHCNENQRKKCRE